MSFEAPSIDFSSARLSRHQATGDFVGTIWALLAPGATLPQDPEELEPSEAMLDVLP
jgi:hypothetical protein